MRLVGERRLVVVVGIVRRDVAGVHDEIGSVRSQASTARTLGTAYARRWERWVSEIWTTRSGGTRPMVRDGC